MMNGPTASSGNSKDVFALGFSARYRGAFAVPPSRMLALQFPLISWYVYFMKSYLAIIDVHGLRYICEETDQTTKLLSRQVNRNGELAAALVWVVTKREAYRRAVYSLAAGLRCDAWEQLQVSADQMGTVALGGTSLGTNSVT